MGHGVYYLSLLMHTIIFTPNVDLGLGSRKSSPIIFEERNLLRANGTGEHWSKVLFLGKTQKQRIRE